MDKYIEALTFRRKTFFTIASDPREYERGIIPTEELINELKKKGADIFTFIERRWCYPISNPSSLWLKTEDNIGLLKISNYGEWLKRIGKKTRNMIRKAEKSGIRTEVVEPDRRLAEGVWRIYNETPIRQARGFPHYGVQLENVMHNVLSLGNCTYIGAYLQDRLVGFIQLVHSDDITIISQILSMQEHWDKAVNNALVAKAVEFCANKGIKWVMYGRMGNHPTLDTFKENNGCVKFPLTRFFIPLTKKGKVAAKLGLHRELKDVLPQSAKYPLIPIYDWISRNRMRIKVRLKSRKQR